MQRSEFDSSFSLYKLSELIEKFPSKRKLKEFLQTFPCSINPDLEDFLNNKAVTFEKHLRSRTYIYIDNQTKKVAAYFTIAISTLHTEGISSEVIKMLDGYTVFAILFLFCIFSCKSNLARKTSDEHYHVVQWKGAY